MKKRWRLTLFGIWLVAVVGGLIAVCREHDVLGFYATHPAALLIVLFCALVGGAAAYWINRSYCSSPQAARRWRLAALGGGATLLTVASLFFGRFLFVLYDGIGELYLDGPPHSPWSSTLFYRAVAIFVLAIAVTGFLWFQFVRCLRKGRM